jgi:YD repeat-containing protein
LPFCDVSHRSQLVNGLGEVTTIGSDAAYRVTLRIDPLGGVRTALYNAVGIPSASIDALGNITTQYYDAACRRTAVQNARGFLSTTVYDRADRVVADIDPLGNITTPGSREALPPSRPLRTVQDTFASHGSSISSAPICRSGRGGLTQYAVA